MLPPATGPTTGTQQPGCPRGGLDRPDERPSGSCRGTDLLEPSYTTTRRPYKGIAHYWSLRQGGHLVQDVVWTYPEPFHDAEAVCGLMCFVDDLVDLEVANDGHPG